MKQRYHLSFFLFVLCVCFSCKSPEQIISKRMKQSGIVLDKKWSKTLEKGKKDAGEAWFKMFDHDFKLLEQYFHISLTESDLSRLKYYPIEIYDIDSVTLANFGATSNMKNILKLNKEKALYYVFKDNQFVLSTVIQFANGKMTTIENAAPYKTVSDAINEIMFNRNLPLFYVEINPSPKVQKKSGINVFIDERGELKYIKGAYLEESFNEYLMNIADIWRSIKAQK